MSSGDIIAYIGAAAWIPQIINLFYKHITKPNLKVFFNDTVELSYTSFGPILNIRMSILSEIKPILLEEVSIEIIHSDGDVHQMKWIGITEMYSEISDQNGNKQFITKDQPAIALKLPQDLLVEKFIKFQEPKYHNQDTSLVNELHSHINFLKNKSAQDLSHDILESNQFHNLISYREDYFWWKKGEYTLKLNFKSPEKFKFENNLFEFSLNQTDIELLKFNIPNLKDSLDCQIRLSDDIANIKWNWLYPKVMRK